MNDNGSGENIRQDQNHAKLLLQFIAKGQFKVSKNQPFCHYNNNNL